MSLTQQQQAIRARGIGGSDIAALLGLDPYRGPWDVWASKTGRAEPTPENRFTRWGHRLEDVIADEYRERNGVALMTSSTLVHPARPWHLGTPDRLVTEIRQVGPADFDWGLEIKARGLRQAWKWGAEEEGAAGVPDEVQAQGAWYMALTELPRWDVAVLLDGNDFRVYQLARDLDVEAAMLEVGARFWRDHVEADVPPAFDGGDAAWEYLGKKLSGGAAKVSLHPTPEIEALAVELERALLDLEDAERRKSTLRQQLADYAARAGIRGFRSKDWSYNAVERRGSVAWKKAFVVACQKLSLPEAERKLIEDGCRGPAIVAPRFMSKRIKTEQEE